MRVYYHPRTKRAYLADFWLPNTKGEIVKALLKMGKKGYARLHFKQLLAIYIQLKLEEEGTPL